jgi:hypothetical protein
VGHKPFIFRVVTGCFDVSGTASGFPAGFYVYTSNKNIFPAENGGMVLADVVLGLVCLYFAEGGLKR